MCKYIGIKAINRLFIEFLPACLECTVTAKSGYIWPEPTWVCVTWSSVESSIGNNETSFIMPRKMYDEKKYRIEERRKDPVFTEIEKTVSQIADDYSYDFKKAYNMKVKYRNPNTKLGACEEYANAVVKAFNKHPLVANVEKWISKKGNHAWNVLVLKDGRRLYCDATWYDGASIDDEGYVSEISDQDPVNLTFNIKEFNSMGGATVTTTGELAAVHFSWKDAKRR
jgi:hypothetical protein